MAKLLIIEDHLRMARMIQKYIQTINPLLVPENTFCFCQHESLALCSLNEITDDDTRVILKRRKEEVFSNVYQFLNDRPAENVLIFIDVLLNSQNISAPSFERYRADKEYSCELYAELIRIKNGKRVPGYGKIDPKHFFHMIYSRSDSSIGVVAAVLEDLYAHSNKKEENYFPIECARFENISWCRNRYDITNSDFSVAEAQESGPVLALPSGYKEFFRSLK